MSAEIQICVDKSVLGAFESLRIFDVKLSLHGWVSSQPTTMLPGLKLQSPTRIIPFVDSNLAAYPCASHRSHYTTKVYSSPISHNQMQVEQENGACRMVQEYRVLHVL